MSSISETIARLAALRKATGVGSAATVSSRLGELSDFGSNPGALRAWSFGPRDLAPHSALVVVLHGCTQTAAGYDHGSGWSRVAEEHGFALLYPEQQRANNPNLCFNWFARDDARRDQGEALSIRQMVGAMIARHDLDPARVFITGLSAGGAMTTAMLATYPEVFAGGAVIAGLPYGTAWSVQDAMTRMRGQGLPGGAALAALVGDASDHAGPWPTLSIWHGGADHTVSPANAEALAAQWRTLYRVGESPAEVRDARGHRHRIWRDGAGRVAVEDHRIAGMGHGTPLDTAAPEGCGAAGPHMLDVGLSSTRLIAAQWGLAPLPGGARDEQPRAAAPEPEPATSASWPFAMPVKLPDGVERTIGDALRAAGLAR